MQFYIYSYFISIYYIGFVYRCSVIVYLGIFNYSIVQYVIVQLEDSQVYCYAIVYYYIINLVYSIYDNVLQYQELQSVHFIIIIIFVKLIIKDYPQYPILLFIMYKILFILFSYILNSYCMLIWQNNIYPVDMIHLI